MVKIYYSDEARGIVTPEIVETLQKRKVKLLWKCICSRKEISSHPDITIGKTRKISVKSRNAVSILPISF